MTKKKKGGKGKKTKTLSGNLAPAGAGQQDANLNPSLQMRATTTSKLDPPEPEDLPLDPPGPEMRATSTSRMDPLEPPEPEVPPPDPLVPEQRRSEIWYKHHTVLENAPHIMMMGTTSFWSKPYDVLDEGHEDEILLKTYENQEDAILLHRRLQSHRKNVNIMSSYHLHFSIDGTATLFLEKIPKSFKHWIENSAKVMWILDSTNIQILCAGESFVKVFKGISNGLEEFFAKDGYHGNLKQGVRVNLDGDVLLVDPIHRIDQIKAKRQDLMDFASLVADVIEYHYKKSLQKQILPDSVNLFSEFSDLISNVDHCDLDSLSYLLLRNPLFYSGNDRLDFLRKVIEMFRAECFKIKEHVVLDCPPYAMIDWQSRIKKEMNGRFHNFYKILSFQFEGAPSVHRSYDVSWGILLFYKNTFGHYPNKIINGCDDAQVEGDLLELFPDFIPKVFYKLGCVVLDTEVEPCYMKENFIAHISR